MNKNSHSWIEISFRKDGSIYNGYDVGTYIPESGTGSKRIVKCEKFDTLLHIDESQVITNQKKGDYWMNKPVYSTCENGKWWGLNANKERIKGPYNTHKELKNECGVDSVKGYEYDEQKYYVLIYSPDKIFSTEV